MSVGLVLLVSAGLLVWVLISFHRFKHEPLITSATAEEVLTIKVPPGTGTASLLTRLHNHHYLKNPHFWKVFAFIRAFNRDLKTGEYEITPGMSLSQLLHKMVRGQVYLRQATIVEGWTYQELRDSLETNPHLKHVMGHLTAKQILNILGSKRTQPEGMFYPDTYYYTWGDSDFDILKQAYTKMQQLLPQLWHKRKTGLPYHTSYQALIVASLIEKEAALVNERRLVASVIVNRLDKNMPLQIDATVIYGLGADYQQALTKADLKRYSPYNTYLHRGLPPTPIALPSKSSIRAALHPLDSKFLYYVARGDGGHKFSVNYQQHLQAIRKYLHN